MAGERTIRGGHFLFEGRSGSESGEEKKHSSVSPVVRVESLRLILLLVYTDEINDSGGFFQLVDICVDKLRPLVGFCTLFLALF